MAVDFASNLTNLTEKHWSDSPAEQPAWYWILLTVSGNGLVIFLILERRNLQITCNWFVLSLSVADFFVGLLLSSLSFICQQKGISCNNAVFYSAFNTFLVISIANTCMMTFDWYFGIVHALGQFLGFPCNARMFAFFLAWSGLHWSSRPSQEDPHGSYSYANPLWVSTTSYFVVYAHANTAYRSKTAKTNTAAQLAQLRFNQARKARIIPNSRLRMQERSVKVIGAVVILFVICWTFDIYKSLCRHYFECPVDEIVIDHLSLLFIYTISALNPVVCTLLKRDVRTEVRNLFRCP